MFLFKSNGGSGGGGGGITGTGIANQVTFWTGAATVGGDTAFLFDPITKRLKIGSALGTIDATLHVRTNSQEGIRLEGGTSFPIYFRCKNASVDNIFRVQGASVASRGGVVDVYTKPADNNQNGADVFALRIDQNQRLILGATSGSSKFTNTGDVSLTKQVSTAVDYTVLSTDFNVDLVPVPPAPITITLPSAGGTDIGYGKIFIIKDVLLAASLLTPFTITAQAGETIDGALTYVMTNPGEVIWLMSLGGTKWKII